MLDCKLHDEPGRVAALHRYNVLDTGCEEPFDKITALVRSILGTPICAVSLVDGDRQWFKSQQGLPVRETPRSISFCTHTIQTCEPLVIADTSTDPRFWDSPMVIAAPHIAAYAGVPLATPDGYNVGALCVIDVVPRDFAPAQIEILKRFAALVVDELELRQIAQCDHLTGALSRRGFLTQVEGAVSLFERHGRAAALVMIDIDHFKSVNDRFGHPAGDAVLKVVAAACRAQLRPNDRFGRIGGEEFAVLLSETGSDEAAIVTERIRAAIAAIPVSSACPAAVTASFGIARLEASLCPADLWFAVADAALYDAKRSGRNRCTVATPNLRAAA